MGKPIDWNQLYQQSVMIVDDSHSYRQLINALLSHVGFKNIHCVGSCDEAVELFKSKRIDITFLDVDMPETDGLEALKRLMAIDKRAYIVMLTGHDTAEIIQQSRDAGAKAFVSKPCGADKIKTVLEDYAQHVDFLK